MPTPEEKVIDKIRQLLIADTTIKGYVKTRVYASHIANEADVKYPALSIHLFPSFQDYANREYIRFDLQIDIWMHSHEHKTTDMYTVFGRVRALLDRQNLRDTTIGVKVAEIAEVPGSPLMKEDDTNLLHLPIRYRVVAS